jgi:hypothetical protein
MTSILGVSATERRIQTIAAVEGGHHDLPGRPCVSQCIDNRIAKSGLVIASVIAGILITAHPTVAIAIAGTVALVIIFAIRERWHGRPF